MKPTFHAIPSLLTLSCPVLRSSNECFGKVIINRLKLIQLILITLIVVTFYLFNCMKGHNKTKA